MEERKRTNAGRRVSRVKRKFEVPADGAEVTSKRGRARADRNAAARPTAKEKSVYSLKNTFGASAASVASAGWNALAGTLGIGANASPYDQARDQIRKDPEFIAKYGEQAEPAPLIDFEKVATDFRDIAAMSDSTFKVPAEFRETTLGKFIAGGASLVPAIPTMGMSAFGQLYSESINDSEQSSGLKFADMSDQAQQQAKEKAMGA